MGTALKIPRGFKKDVMQKPSLSMVLKTVEDDLKALVNYPQHPNLPTRAWENAGRTGNEASEGHTLSS